ncbi:hypothetical protein WAI453_003195 [Rhynchosporium graminicola]
MSNNHDSRMSIDAILNVIPDLQSFRPRLPPFETLGRPSCPGVERHNVLVQGITPAVDVDTDMEFYAETTLPRINITQFEDEEMDSDEELQMMMDAQVVDEEPEPTSSPQKLRYRNCTRTKDELCPSPRFRFAGNENSRTAIMDIGSSFQSRAARPEGTISFLKRTSVDNLKAASPSSQRRKIVFTALERTWLYSPTLESLNPNKSQIQIQTQIIQSIILLRITSEINVTRVKIERILFIH